MYPIKMDTAKAQDRKIIHIDMDCFYAAIEMRDRPALKHQPIAVGGSPDGRGVLCTSNYLARQYGVRSAMASSHALRLCPGLIILPVDMPKYRAVSQAIQQIFYQFTDQIEPLSLDEAYLDVSSCQDFYNSASLIAKAIREKIFASQHITASAGIASNKFLAKVASDWNKPNNQFVITPKDINAFVQQLPVNKIFGVGKITAAKLAKLNIQTCGQLQQFSLFELTKKFGRFGQQLYHYARGIDERPLQPHRSRKSISIEHTYPEDLSSLTNCLIKLPELFYELIKRLKKYNNRTIQKQFIKIKFSDFQTTTVESTTATISYQLYQELLKSGLKRHASTVRLLGLGIGFKSAESIQQILC